MPSFSFVTFCKNFLSDKVPARGGQATQSLRQSFLQRRAGVVSFLTLPIREIRVIRGSTARSVSPDGTGNYQVSIHNSQSTIKRILLIPFVSIRGHPLLSFTPVLFSAHAAFVVLRYLLFHFLFRQSSRRSSTQSFLQRWASKTKRPFVV